MSKRCFILLALVLVFSLKVFSENKQLPLRYIQSLEKENLPLAVFISGDGGWTDFDEAICQELAKKGIPVLGLDSQKYFWSAKPIQQATNEISAFISSYMKQSNRTSFVLIGYSFGACIVPFMATHLPVNLKSSMKGLFCLSPDETTDFEIHITDMLSINSTEKYSVLSEIKKTVSLHPVCFFGNEESIDIRKKFTMPGVQVEVLSGNHHYNDNAVLLVTVMLKYII